MRANGEQLEYVQAKVARGEYRVDSGEVADAMIDRLAARTIGRQTVICCEGDRAQMQRLIALRAA